jgi:glycosyltransferase involved in cell wall biosynthesis
MKLSIIIPCYNEVNTIETIVDAVKDIPYHNKEIIIVDDHSTDGTREKLINAIESTIYKVIYHDRNKGKGAALRSGIKAVTGDIVIFQDADLEYSPSEIPVIIQPILDGKADVVFGSRFIGGKTQRMVYFSHMAGNKIITALSNILTRTHLTDMATCYKAFKREIIQSIDLKENSFGCEPEITVKVAKKKARIHEVGISYNGRTYENGKKIRWKDGVRVIYCIFKYSLFSK